MKFRSIRAHRRLAFIICLVFLYYAHSSGVLISSVSAALLLTELSLSTTAATSAQSVVTLSGVITDRLGAPVANATTTLYSVDRVLQTSSDVKGQFRLAQVPPGTYQVEVVHDGFKTWKVAALRLNERNEPLSISLEVSDARDCNTKDSISYADMPGRKLNGVVLDSQRPVAGAAVDLVGISVPVLATRRSNDDGEFLFVDIEPGQYYLRVSHPGHRDERSGSFWIARETTTKVKVEMIRQGFLRVCQ